LSPPAPASFWTASAEDPKVSPRRSSVARPPLAGDICAGASRAVRCRASLALGRGLGSGRCGGGGSRLPL